MANVLVTGGSGYFGSLLVQRLCASDHSARVLDISDAEDRPTDVDFFKADIRDPEETRKACRNVDVVYHCVAQVPLAKKKDLLWSVNRDGTSNLMEAAKREKVSKVIYVSSSAVFGVPKDVPITPDTPPKPAEEYGKAKLEGENICHRYAEQGVDVSIIRPRTIMGHGRLGIMQLVFEWVYQGRDVFVLGRGDNKYQFVHADDLAEACLKAAEKPGSQIYNIGAESFGTMRETLEGLVAHAGTASRVRSLPYRLAVLGMKLTSSLGLSPLAVYHHLVYGKDVYFDLNKPKQELGWQPQWGNVEMFTQSYDWYLRHRQEILAAKGRSAHRSPVKERILKLLRWI